MKMFAMILNKTLSAFIFFCFTMMLLVASFSDVYAVSNENNFVDAYATSLANSITGNPDLLMAIHVNPAGLSLLGEGGYFSQGFGFVRVQRKGTFSEDPDFPGFMGGLWSPRNSSSYDGTEATNPWNNPREDQERLDPLSDHSGPDPLGNKSGKTSAGVFYFPIPAIGRLKVPIFFASNQVAARRQPGSRWTLAWGMYAPFAGGIAHDDKGDPHKFGIRHAYNQHYIYSAPSASYEFSPQLSVGFSIGLAQRAMGVKVNARSPSDLTALTRVLGDATKNLNIPVISQETMPGPWYNGGIGPYEHVVTAEIEMRDDFCPTFNLGLLWRPRPWFSLGACYRSESKAELHGKYKFKYSEQFQAFVDYSNLTEMTRRSAAMLDNPMDSVPTQTGAATSTQTLPRIVALGIKLQPIKKLKLLFNVKWANWSIAKQMRITFDQRIQPLRSAKLQGYVYGASDMVVDDYMKDTWNLAVGLEYQVTDKFSIRMGVEDRPKSVQMSMFSLGSLFMHSRLYGIGCGIKLPKGKTIDIGFGHHEIEDVYIRNNTSTRLNSTDFTKRSPYPGLNYKQAVEIDMVTISIRIPLEARKLQLSKPGKAIKRLFEIIAKPFTYLK